MKTGIEGFKEWRVEVAKYLKTHTEKETIAKFKEDYWFVEFEKTIMDDCKKLIKLDVV